MKKIAGLCVAALLVACGSNLSAQPVAGKISPKQMKTALVELEKLAGATLKAEGLPGLAIVIVHQNEVVYLQGFGVREVGNPERIDADTVFQLASVSKPITSTVLAALVGEGVIGWDDRVVDRDPAFALHEAWTTRALTLRDLLCHRSGLPDHAGDLLEDLGYDREQVLHRLRFLPTKGRFRAQYAYTNFGYTEAAVAAARAVGKPWETIAEERLYQPLGMKSTSSHYDDFARAKNRALLHVKVGDRFVAKNTRQPDAQSPAGGVSSTAADMARWLRLQLGEGEFEGRRLVAADALAETHRPQFVLGFDPVAGRLSSYGLGW
ncbi:MAG TPA: serine hydrolase domain-containing protein, partial [Planctomycetaceae bacterium]